MADYFFQLMLKLDIFHTPFEARFFLHRELKVRFFSNSVLIFRVEARFVLIFRVRQDYFFATYQNKKHFSTYRLGQIIVFSHKQGQIIFSKSLPAPPPLQIMKWSLPKGSLSLVGLPEPRPKLLS